MYSTSFGQSFSLYLQGADKEYFFGGIGSSSGVETYLNDVISYDGVNQQFTKLTTTGALFYPSLQLGARFVFFVSKNSFVCICFDFKGTPPNGTRLHSVVYLATNQSV